MKSRASVSCVRSLSQRFCSGSSRCAWVLLLLLAGMLPAVSNTLVKLGSISQISGSSDLDLEGDFVYAINFSSDDPVRTVRGVAFQPDRLRIIGATLSGPQFVTPWQTRPEFGSNPDDDQLEEIFADIRWANSGASERLRASLIVTTNTEYKLQVLISGNGPENRRWDIRVNGREAVDEITSLGASPGQGYLRNRATVYTWQFVSTNRTVVVEMGDLFGRNDGGDRNPIWQALTLERIINPPTPDDLKLAPSGFFATQSAPVGRLAAVDRKSGVTHGYSLVPGEGDTDNAKFTLNGADLLPSPFDFKSAPAGSIYSIRARTVDTADPTRFLEKILQVTLEAPHAPDAVVPDAEFISLGAKAGARVALLAVRDADSFDRHDLTLVAGAGGEDNAWFRLDGRDLRLVQDLPADMFAARVLVRATDLAGLAIDQPLVFQVANPRLRVNEAVGTGSGGLSDEQGQLQDWVEIYNELPQWVDLAGWQLSDRPDRLDLWTFPATALAPNGYLVVLADGVGTGPAGSTQLHAGFSLGAEGTPILLTAPSAATASSVLQVPVFFPGASYGLNSDLSSGHFQKPTPGALNGATAEYGANEVRFSQEHGYLGASFLLELSATDPGSEIRYTLDGSLPGRDTGLIYTNPIPIAPSTVAVSRGSRIVRAVALSARAAFAPVKTQTYLFLNGTTSPAADGVLGQSLLTASITKNTNYSQIVDDALLALPAMSLILPNGPTGEERAASLELFDPAGQEAGFQIDCGVVATGTTSLGSPKLSMAARFRSDYGSSRLRYPVYARGSLFPEGAATEFRELRLRSHSHDTFYWLGTVENPPVPYGDPPVSRSGDAQLARNPWIDEMQLMMQQPGKHARQVHMYLNGTYHGIYHIQEHPDEDFMASYLPGSSEDYHFTAAAIGGSEHSSTDTWFKPWQSLKSSLSNYTQAGRWIDMTNLCDYMLLSFYAGNDWDWSAQHNWSAAGPTLPDKGGWRFFEQDSDITLQDVDADCTDQDVPDGIFTLLMRYPDFRSLFRDRAYLHCYNGGALTPKRAGGLYDVRMKELILPIVAESARWQPSSSVSALPWDRNQEWTNEWRYLRETFFPNRTDRLIQQFRQRPGWWPADPPQLSRLSGTVPAGYALSLLTEKGFVYYTTDGSDPRLPGGTVNPKALRLDSAVVRTSLVQTGAVWSFLDTGVYPGPAWTSNGFDASEWRSGPTEIGYGDGGEATVAGFVDTDPVTSGIQRNLTTYFRREFDVPDAARFFSYTLRLLRDDGAVVYLNGQEIWRTNMTSGVITNGSRALRDISGASETNFLEKTFLPSSLPLLPLGNVLAVEVHQVLPSSVDMSFNLEFIGNSPPASSIVPITQPTLIRVRTYTGTDWSAMAESYLVPEGIPAANPANLLLTEIHYEPQGSPTNEFLEFLNRSGSTIDLSDVVVTQAVYFRFPKATLMKPGERLVLTKDPAAFESRYIATGSPYRRDAIRFLGPWSGSLANEGEEIRLLDAAGATLFSCTYGSEVPWPALAAGKGPSLVLVDSAPAPKDPAGLSAWLSQSGQWRHSQEIHGSPGDTGLPAAGDVVLNEVLAASIPPITDSVELVNLSLQPRDISGWFLSDSGSTPRKYRFPADTILGPGARLVVRESDFNRAANPACLVPFALDGGGEQVLLIEANAQGDLLRVADFLEFGQTPSGVALGRSPDGTGPWQWLSSSSPGGVNGAARAGYASWSATAFPPGVPAALRSPEADPDGDGVSNQGEYVFVLQPNRQDSAPLSLTGLPQDQGLTFSYRTRTGASELQYRVEVSTDLNLWDGTGARVETLGRTPMPDGSTRVIARIRRGEGPGRDSYFVRLAVDLP